LNYPGCATFAATIVGNVSFWHYSGVRVHQLATVVADPIK